ncbi:SapC family protein [Massilia sp. TSP1-1-2]|uniref:SapC family protein n=1 Tax=Massilia sp. TSP1-1-2 TaxID=2804649 RepID=UPI003CF553C0
MSSTNFYQRPAALNRKHHRNLKLDTGKSNYLFAAHTNSLLLASTELIDAAASYPLVFVGNDGGPYTLAAMVGLNNAENLFVDAAGKWDAGSYVPAFVRRYPFVLSGGGGDGEPEMTVCIDEAFAGLNEAAGQPLFDTQGKETPLLAAAIDFLQHFHAEMLNTNAFAERLSTLGLLTARSFEVLRNGNKLVVEGVVIIDAEKLATLDDATVLAMVRSGDMALAHAHLLSLKQIPHLAVRMEERHSPQS